MYQLLAETQVNPVQWNDDVVRLNGCAFHCYEYSLFVSEKSNEIPIYFRLYDGSGITHSLAIGLMKNTRFAGKTFFKTLSFGCFPAFNDLDLLKIMIREIIQYCHRTRVMSLRMLSFATPFGTDILNDLGFSTERRWEFLVNMPANEEELWGRLHSKKRNLIRKAQKEKIRVEQVTQIDGVMELRKLAFETQKRKEDRGIPFSVADESYYRLLKNKLIDSGLGRLFLAYEESEPIAGAFFVGYNKRAYYMLSSAKEKGLQKAAPDLILWTSMKNYQQEGYKIFNFGGLSERELNGEPLEKSGLFHFKKRFSTDEYLCFKGDLVLRPNAGKIYNFLKKFKSRLSV